MPAAPRFRSAVRDQTLAVWRADQRVTALDRYAVAALADRAQAEGFAVYLQLTPAGVPYVVLPRRWLVALTAEEPDRWGFAVPSRSYLLRVVLPRHRHGPFRHPAAPKPPGTPPAAAADEPPKLGEGFRKWAW